MDERRADCARSEFQSRYGFVAWSGPTFALVTSSVHRDPGSLPKPGMVVSKRECDYRRFFPSSSKARLGRRHLWCFHLLLLFCASLRLSGVLTPSAIKLRRCYKCVFGGY